MKLDATAGARPVALIGGEILPTTRHPSVPNREFSQMNKSGRPPIDPAEKRAALVQAKITNSELAAFDRYRESLGRGVSRSDALRTLVLAALEQGTTP